MTFDSATAAKDSRCTPTVLAADNWRVYVRIVVGWLISNMANLDSSSSYLSMRAQAFSPAVRFLTVLTDFDYSALSIGRLQLRPHCVRWGPNKGGGQQPLIFGPCLLWPNGWMDPYVTWYEGRPRPMPHCVRWKPSSPPKGAQQPCSTSAHVYCGQTAGWIKIPLSEEIGLGRSDIVLNADPAPPTERGTAAPTFRPMSIVVKRSPLAHLSYCWARFSNGHGKQKNVWANIFWADWSATIRRIRYVIVMTVYPLDLYAYVYVGLQHLGSSNRLSARILYTSLNYL